MGQKDKDQDKMYKPSIRSPLSLKLNSRNLPNLLELSLILVAAFPNASIKGLTLRTKNQSPIRISNQ